MPHAVTSSSAYRYELYIPMYVMTCGKRRVSNRAPNPWTRGTYPQNVVWVAALYRWNERQRRWVRWSAMTSHTGRANAFGLVDPVAGRSWINALSPAFLS
jgi:hypothetical protein